MSTPYGPPPGGYAVIAPSRPTNGMAIAALVCGLAAFAGFTIASIPAVICGHKAMKRTRETGEEGYDIAVAGTVLGWVGVALILLVVIAMVVFFGAAWSFSNNLPDQ